MIINNQHWCNVEVMLGRGIVFNNLLPQSINGNEINCDMTPPSHSFNWDEWPDVTVCALWIFVSR